MSEAEQPRSEAPERVTFQYEKLGNRWCHFDTEEERQAAIEMFIADLRRYFAEGYEGDGDGWAPRSWEETNRLVHMVYAARDLRWQRDADGQGGIDIYMAPRALGTVYNIFVPREPEMLKQSEWRASGNRRGDPEPVTDLEQREWIADTMRIAERAAGIASDITRQVSYRLQDMNSRERDEIAYQKNWQEMITAISKAETPLAAQHLYLDLNYGASIDDAKYRVVHDLIWETFGSTMKEEFDTLLADIDVFGNSVLKEGGDYHAQAPVLAARILSFQTRHGYIPTSRARNRFNRIGDMWREEKGKATGLKRSEWHRNGVPEMIRVGQYAAENDVDMAEPYHSKRR